MKLEFDPVADAAYFEISPVEVITSKESEPGIIGDWCCAERCSISSAIALHPL